MEVSIRPAEPGDVDDVVGFTRETWRDQETGDYLPEAFPQWVENDDPDQRTLVADADGRAVGVVQAVLLSPDEAWLQGMRVDPDCRGRGLGTRLSHAGFAWASEQGATVGRSMVFSWNEMGLGLARAAGFDPETEFRLTRPEPDADAELGDGVEVTADPGSGWTYWGRSDARDHLRGLGLDPTESWAVSTVTRERLERAADRGHLVVIEDDGTRALSYRSRTFEREVDDGTTERWAEYGVAAWADPAACEALFAAIARDAGSSGVDRTRVLVPETVEAVSDVALAGHEIADEPDFVLGADLTREFEM